MMLSKAPTNGREPEVIDRPPARLNKFLSEHSPSSSRCRVLHPEHILANTNKCKGDESILNHNSSN